MARLHRRWTLLGAALGLLASAGHAHGRALFSTTNVCANTFTPAVPQPAGWGTWVLIGAGNTGVWQRDLIGFYGGTTTSTTVKHTSRLWRALDTCVTPGPPVVIVTPKPAFPGKFTQSQICFRVVPPAVIPPVLSYCSFMPDEPGTPPTTLATFARSRDLFTLPEMDPMSSTLATAFSLYGGASSAYANEWSMLSGDIASIPEEPAIRDMFVADFSALASGFGAVGTAIMGGIPAPGDSTAFTSLSAALRMTADDFVLIPDNLGYMTERHRLYSAADLLDHAAGLIALDLMAGTPDEQLENQALVLGDIGGLATHLIDFACEAAPRQIPSPGVVTSLLLGALVHRRRRAA